MDGDEAAIVGHYELAADGYRVHLVDLTARHVERARADLGGRGVTAEIGDARHLAAPDGSFDAVLLFGAPVRPHRTRRSDRGVARSTAGRRAPGAWSRSRRSAGLALVELVGVEGIAHWLRHLADRFATAEGRETILFAARAIEGEPSLLGLSSHLIAVARADSP